MITYKKVTREELIRWQENNPIDINNPVSNMHLSYFENSAMDDIVAILAFENDTVIGRNLLTYANLLVHGKLIKYIVSKNLYVLEEYRKKSIGVFLKLHVLQLGLPQISSSVSRQMQNIYDSWKDFRRIDASPFYVIPLTIFGIINTSRLSYYKKINSNKISKFSLLSQLIKQSYNAIKLQFKRNRIQVLTPNQAIAELDSILNTAYFPVQVPWNKSLIKDTLIETQANNSAWVVSINNTNTTAKEYYFISIYYKYKTVRLIGSKHKKVKEAFVNEIYPPVKDHNTLFQLLKFCSKKAKSNGSDLLYIAALNDIMNMSCQQLGLDTFYDKSIYIAFKKLDENLASILSNKTNWWCRAMSEDQFEEADQEMNLLPLASNE